MPEKDFIIWVDADTYIRVAFATIQGRMIAFVVRLMWRCDNQENNIARYDMAHGIPHRDEMGRRIGLIAKTWFPELRPEAVLNLAIVDFRRNYEYYIAQFTRH